MEFQGEGKTQNSNWAKGHSCDILVKNLTPFCPRPKTLAEVKLKNNGLISLKEEISRQLLNLWFAYQ